MFEALGNKFESVYLIREFLKFKYDFKYTIDDLKDPIKIDY